MRDVVCIEQHFSIHTVYGYNNEFPNRFIQVLNRFDNIPGARADTATSISISPTVNSGARALPCRSLQPHEHTA